MKSLKDHVALVTGGSSGIGLAVVKTLLDQGMKVSFCGRDEKKLNKAEKEVQGHQGRFMAASADVSRKKEVDRWVEQSIKAWGRVDLLVNNAGVASFSEVEKITDKDWDYQLDINLKGPLYCSQAIIPQMKRQRGGYIINISSVLGKTSFSGTAAYAASKFGLMALSDSLRDELHSHHIKVTAICPGYVATPLVADAPVPQSEMIQPEDIANTIVYLMNLSDYAVIKEIVITRPGEE
jgi:3-oxoacyl-[acyl-carrier protein] reductase